MPEKTQMPAHPWHGTMARKPWEYKVTAVVPHWETPELLPLCVASLQAQTERPYVMIVDTGSSPETYASIENHYASAEGVEVHRVNTKGVRHSSEKVCFAQDAAMAWCQTEFLFCTHADVFLKRRGFLQYLLDGVTTELPGVHPLLEPCSAKRPVVGYQMSPRHMLTERWVGMVSHTATMLHLAELRAGGVSWTMQRCEDEFGAPRASGWLDTEVPFNQSLQKAGIVPYLIGVERNYNVDDDPNLVHVRSYTSAKNLAPSSPYYAQVRGWMATALQDAHERVEKWKKS